MNTEQPIEDRVVQSRARQQADGKRDLHLAGFAKSRPLPQVANLNTLALFA